MSFRLGPDLSSHARCKSSLKKYTYISMITAASDRATRNSLYEVSLFRN